MPLFGPVAGGLDTAATEGHAPTSGTGEVPYRVEMEHAFGEDFGSVRVETGAGMANIGAAAAACGESVAFDSPHPDRGVVAHELTHVVQRRRAGSAAPSTAVEDAGWPLSRRPSWPARASQRANPISAMLPP